MSEVVSNTAREIQLMKPGTQGWKKRINKWARRTVRGSKVTKYSEGWSQKPTGIQDGGRMTVSRR